MRGISNLSQFFISPFSLAPCASQYGTPASVLSSKDGQSKRPILCDYREPGLALQKRIPSSQTQVGLFKWSLSWDEGSVLDRSTAALSRATSANESCRVAPFSLQALLTLAFLFKGCSSALLRQSDPRRVDGSPVDLPTAVCP